ncbi:MAG TPA: EAL domain-containing protein [Mycobacteriales bacterium]|nr:EAL domain-containing protein [Mycobacteriales bacterium]HVX69441.1 EAL domain-containing protein [Mycobacteriales bacterium]
MLSLAEGTRVVHYLPDVDLSTGAVTGMQALMRWEHPQRGVLWPSDFMAEAERSGLGPALGWDLLTHAAIELSAWRTLPGGQDGTRQMWVSITASQLLEVDFADRVASLVTLNGLMPGSLGLLLPDAALAMGSQHAPALLAELHTAGVALAIDDFRSWYGSFGVMAHLPFEAVMLDRAFVRGVGADLEDDGIVGAVITFAHAQGLRVVADSVESWSEGARLCELGCDRGHGYLFSGPQSSDDARLMLSHGRGWCPPAPRTSPESERITAR